MESEGKRAQREYPDTSLEIVYPSYSILMEPVIAIVDTHVEKRKTRAAAEIYVDFIFSKEGQKIISENGFRLCTNLNKKPLLSMIPVTSVLGSWKEIQDQHFSSKGSFAWIQQLRAAKRGGVE